MAAEHNPAPLKKKNPLKNYLLIIIALFVVIGTIAATILMLQNAEWVHRLQSYGYAGLFLVALIAGSPLPVPSFCAALVLTLGAVLNPVLVGLTAGLGFSIGRMLVYLMARGGSNLLEVSKISDLLQQNYAKLGNGILHKLKINEFLEYMKRHATFAVFLMALIPNPFLLPAIIALGLKRASPLKVFLACWAGKGLLYIGMAFVGYFGLHLLGIN